MEWMRRPPRYLVLVMISLSGWIWNSTFSHGSDLTTDPVECCKTARAVLSRVLAGPPSGEPIRVPVGQKQLFLDNYILDSLERVTRRLHQPTKHGAVIRPERDWEDSSPQVRTGPSWNPTERFWMLWYTGGAYATSRDGERWEKPLLGLREYKGSKQNNLMLPVTEFEFKDAFGRELLKQQGDGTTIDNVFYDPLDPDPSRRYKGMGYKGPICCLTAGRGMGFFPAVSADGKTWRLLDSAFIPTGDEAHLFHDEARGLYVATVKHSGPYGRSVYLAVSTDFAHWTDPRDCLIFHADAKDQELGAQRVQMHLKNPELRKPVFHNPEEYVTDIYNLPVFPYEGIYIGMPTVFNHSGNTTSNSDGYNMVELAMSRDLLHWQRVGDRAKFIPLSRLADDNTYDTAQLLAANRPIVTEKEVWFYYSGLKWRSRPKDLSSPDPGGGGAICLAKLRRDGFVSLTADASTGSVVTRRIVAAGATLRVNVDARAGGLRAEILDADRKPVPGFSLEESIPVTADDLKAGVRWRKASLTSLAGKTIRMRFELRNASLYAFWFE